MPAAHPHALTARATDMASGSQPGRVSQIPGCAVEKGFLSSSWPSGEPGRGEPLDRPAEGCLEQGQIRRKDGRRCNISRQRMASGLAPAQYPGRGCQARSKRFRQVVRVRRHHSAKRPAPAALSTNGFDSTSRSGFAASYAAAGAVVPRVGPVDRGGQEPRGRGVGAPDAPGPCRTIFARRLSAQSRSRAGARRSSTAVARFLGASSQH